MGADLSLPHLTTSKDGGIMDEDTIKKPKADSPYGFVYVTREGGGFARFCRTFENINKARDAVVGHYFEPGRSDDDDTSSDDEEGEDSAYSTSDSEDSESGITRAEPVNDARAEALMEASRGQHTVDVSQSAPIEASLRQRGATAPMPTATATASSSHWQPDAASAQEHEKENYLDDLVLKLQPNQDRKWLTVHEVVLWPAYVVYKMVTRREGYLAFESMHDDGGSVHRNTDWDEVVEHWIADRRDAVTVHEAALELLLLKCKDYFGVQGARGDAEADALRTLVEDILRQRVYRAARNRVQHDADDAQG